MGDKTGIAWTDATWNPIRGCSRVSEGCRNCYAERVAIRQAEGAYAGLVKSTPNGPRWTGEVRLADEEALTLPLRWKRPRRIFVNSMSDLFHERVPDQWIDRIFAVMAVARQHTFQVLTKRPERMVGYCSDLGRSFARLRNAAPVGYSLTYEGIPLVAWPIPNVWLGVSAENQATADERVSLLLRTPAALRFLSLEPLLGPVHMRAWCIRSPRVDWVIAGGESGPHHRPMQIEWLEAIAAKCDCSSSPVPLFVKQDSGPRAGQQGRIPDHLWARKAFPA